MRRRIGDAGITGLGNSSPNLLDGQSSGDKKRDELINACAEDAYKTFFKGTQMDYDLVDAQATEECVALGIEPSYFGDNLRIVEIHEDRGESCIARGRAFGMWGSGVRSTVSYYRDYKLKSKFVRFVDKWHPLLFGEKS